MRPTPLSLSDRRLLGLLVLVLSLGAPTAGHAALMRYTMSFVLSSSGTPSQSTLNGVNIGGQVFTAYADVDTSTATTSTMSTGSGQLTESRVAVIGKVHFTVGSTTGTLENGIDRIYSFKEYSEEDFGDGPVTLYRSMFRFENSSADGLRMTSGVSSYPSYLDLRGTTTPSATGGVALSFQTWATSAGTLTMSGFVSAPAGTVVRGAAAVPEPSQVALGVLAAGYALITAGRRYRSRSSTTA